MANTEEQIIVTATRRTDKGKNDSRRLRASGKIPVTIYGGEGGAISAAANLADLARIIRSKHGASTLFKIAVDNVETEVTFHDRQIDPVKGRMTHADLKRVVSGQKMFITVPVVLQGEPVGVLEDGGLLDHILHEIQVKCIPSQIPDEITVDVTNLHVNHVLHVSDLKMPEGVEVLIDPQTVVATIRFAANTEEATATPDTTTVE